MAAKKKSAHKLLVKYRKKRDFTKTAEPSGKKAEGNDGNRYLIQKHAARRLHYDFRLEMDGVLKSWAVTRGPSLNPVDKRLAVHVEDHPLDYGDFEGTIPHGEYGGGTVMLWDEGSWEPIGDVHRAYTKGHMDFELHGKRLKGRWHLVRMHGRGKEKRENWLLIKGKDKYANEKDGDYALEHFQKSAVSNRSMEAITKGDKVWQSKPKEKAKLSPAPKRVSKAKNNTKHLALPPDFVAPQLATLVKEPPAGDKWVHEIKYDGYRLLARINNGEVQLITRANNDWTKKFKFLAKTLATLVVENVLLDGEVVCRANDGTMSFHGLQNALKTGAQENLHYYIFDLLFLNGEDVRRETLLERKERLRTILKDAPSIIHFSEHFNEPGEKVLKHACHIALEGIISKRSDAAYHSGRDELWVKSKCTKEQEAVIGGFTMQPKHPGNLAALLTGYYQKGELIFSGKVGTGFSHEEGRDLVKRLKAISRKSPVFKSVPSLSRRGAVWVEPKFVAQIQFAEWTPDGMMRHPSFQGLREDKPAREVVREKPTPADAAKSASQKSANKSGKEKCVIAGINITHPDKVLYPEDDITKEDIARYYEAIAPRMLSYVAGRPISLLRCPEGEGKQCFFQRHGSEKLSPFVKPVRIKGIGDDQPFLMIDNIKGLIALAQMGVLEIHMWGAMADKADKPDRMVFDLDPAPNVDFKMVKEAALEIRDRLKKLKLISFVKTTGGKGLHVIVPFTCGPDWETTKAFSRSFAQVMAEDDTKHFTINNRKEARKGKIYIDYLRNGEGASAIAPYSTRARTGATVAMPLDWNELGNLKNGHAFTIKNVSQRTKKDPWKVMAGIKQKLPV